MLETLPDILTRHPRFTSPKLVKSDTDGMDCQIVMSNRVLLERARPVLFIEYDPDLGGTREVFPFLRALGYRRMLVWENVGDYLLTADLDDERLREDVHAFYSGRGSTRYADVCVFHEEDLDVCDRLRESELAYFRARSSTAQSP